MPASAGPCAVAGTNDTIGASRICKKYLYKSGLHPCSIQGMSHSADGQRQSEPVAQFDQVRHVVGEIALVQNIHEHVPQMIDKTGLERDLHAVSQFRREQVLKLRLETAPAVCVRAEDVKAFKCAVLQESIKELLDWPPAFPSCPARRNLRAEKYLSCLISYALIHQLFPSQITTVL